MGSYGAHAAQQWEQAEKRNAELQDRVAELEAAIRECLSSPLRAVPKHVLSQRTGVLPLEMKEGDHDS